MTYFHSLYSSEIYSLAIRLSYDGHLETQKFLSWQSPETQARDPSLQMGRLSQGDLGHPTAAWALETV